ncbi:MAG: hypothetical protein KDJ40_10555 [Hyphomicrobiales bacterium]|nr:hypothetical protein [Hyphomicrobiales bacterium]MCO5086019.1 hypothetical protein [Methylobacteriaceae bacterium]
MSLRAFAVLETDENTGSIYFASSNIAARRRGANDHADGEIRDVTCYRTPWADAFAHTQQVPASVAVANGWHFECAGCGARIDENTACEDLEPSQNGGFDEIVIRDIIGFVDGPVWCSPSCKEVDDERRRARRDAEQAAIAGVRAMILRRFPDAIISVPGHAYAGFTSIDGRYLVEEISQNFEFPGMKIGPATLHQRRSHSSFIGPIRPQFYCCNGDKDAFKAYADRTRQCSVARA